MKRVGGRGMDNKDMAMLGVVTALIGFLQKEGILNRERLIDYLAEVRAAPAKTSGPEHQAVMSLHNEYLEWLVNVLERSTFD